MKKISLKVLSRLAMLSALCVGLRFAFAGLPNIQPITAIFLVLASSYLGQALVVMATTMLISGFLLLFGPWVFWQIVSFAVVLLLWHRGLYPLTRSSLLWQTVAAGFVAILYGWIIDGISASFYGANLWSYLAAGTVFNLAHAWSTVLFYPIIVMIFRRLRNEKIT